MVKVDQMDWTRADVISVLAFLASMGSLYVAWRAYRRDVWSERPIFWIDRPIISASEGDWHHISVRVRNRMPHAVQCEEIVILRPARAVVAGYFEVTEMIQGAGQRLRRDADPTKFSRRIRMRLAATHAGKAAGPDNLPFKTHGRGDEDDEDFMVHCPPPSIRWSLSFKRRTKLSMRVTWRSKDESSRMHFSDVNTEVMPATISDSSAK